MPELFNTITKKADISYTSRDFNSLRNSLTQYIQQQFPNSISDFTDVSAAMALLECVCYAGDTLHFYLDKQFNELFLETAQEEKNVVLLARNLGYKIRGKSAAQNNNIILKFNYPTSGSITNYEFFLKTGTKFSNKAGDAIFEMISDIDTGTSTSNTKNIDITNNVTSASISGIQAIAGISKTYSIKIGIAISFLKIPVPDTNVLEITSVSSTDGNIWYEVDYLAQENQFVGTVNATSSSAVVPYVLTLRRVPRRFVVERETSGTTFLRFGSGILTTSDSEFIPNPEDYILPFSLRGSVSGFSPASVDPSDFINTGTLGAAPVNTTLVIKYRSGGGLKSNAASKTITEILQKKIEYKVSGNDFNKSQLEASMVVTNPESSTGGEEEETIDQIRYNASAFFASQNRCITLQDYIVRCYTMPPVYGSVFRATASKDLNDKLGIKLSILTRTSDGTLTATSNALKINLVNYLGQFKSLSENINIIDGQIINLGVKFSIIADRTRNQQEVLANCLIAVQDYFNIKKWNFGQSISISLVSKAITNVQGVLAVTEIKFKQINSNEGGRTYVNSSSYYNLEANNKNYIVTCGAQQLIEVRYSKFDVQASVIS